MAVAVGAVVLGAVYAASSVFFAPFLARYELFYSGVTPVKLPTAPSQFLLVNGALLFVVVSYLAYLLARSATVARALTSGVAARVPAPAASYLVDAGADDQPGGRRPDLAAGDDAAGGRDRPLGGRVRHARDAGAGGRDRRPGVAVYRRASREVLFVAGLDAGGARVAGAAGGRWRSRATSAG